jgi:hypothetical protein
MLVDVDIEFFRLISENRLESAIIFLNKQLSSKILVLKESDVSRNLTNSNDIKSYEIGINL